ncbi:hypothetical protein [Blastococcus sp. VKM Ac-2987]|uniref:hypothetical protein n=1 Tax=Blastococcus sp. VKM Ac-2987 TaxID=3004141 RepID=UPI0022ABAD08|nr:hypothetical protein [Blastococcus sp. VKM Ac-2987]MCZ2857940.1 hypothetical protein [Blastococcus sp. VKM Ac-2987]
MSRGRGAVVAWGACAVVLAAWLALVEVFWLPLRIGGVLVPVSVAAAVVGNVLLVRAALRLSGSAAVAALPAVTWLVVVIGAMVRRPEGDLLLGAGGALGGVTLVFLLLGVLAGALAAGSAMGAPRRPVTPAGRAPTGRRTGGAR